MDSLQQFLLDWSYLGLFGLLMFGIVGLPIPDETLLVLSGYLVGQGKLNLAWTAGAAFAGSAFGITASYGIGRTLGHAAVIRYGKRLHVTPERIAGVHGWFERMGNWLLTFGYFVPGVRHFTALVAGLSGTDFRTFALFAYPGAAIWVATFILLGRAVGEHWREAVEAAHHYSTILVITASVVLCAGLLIAAWRRRRGSPVR